MMASSTALLLGSCKPSMVHKAKPHVIIIGGGFGGATAAKYIRKLDKNIKVTLIEAKADYRPCPGSNWVFAGIRSQAPVQFNYHALSSKYSVNIVNQWVNDVDPIQHTVTLADGRKISYDRLVLAPGISFRWQAIEGYDQKISEVIPHAWQGGQQTQLLARQLQAMDDGGTVVICAPPNPYRCPPGPYERASMMTHYLSRYKPKSKTLILDPKAKFAKQNLFITAWKKYYGYGTANSMIEWVSIPDNPVINLDVNSKTVETDFGDRYQANVLNIIPPQKAGIIADKAGVTDQSGWCPVDHRSCESTIHPDIHVIGDAAIYSPLPKSAFAANSEAKICALAMVNLLNGQELLDPTWINTCYSLVTPKHGISVAMVYKVDQKGMLAKVKNAGGVTPNSDHSTVILEAQYAHQWYQSITHDTFM